MGLLDGLIVRAKTAAAKWGNGKPVPMLPNEGAVRSASTSEIGRRPNAEDQVKYAYRLMWVDPDLRQSILDIREMDKLDGRVKRIHSKIARDTVKGGLIMQQGKASTELEREWDEFSRRLQLNRVEKLKSDARGLVMEGNLPYQWVLDKAYNVVSGVRMPSETILPNVGADGRFKDVSKAFVQFDVMTGTELASFPLWQLFHARFDPDNFDDMGSLGRPFLDATRTVWRKLNMTEEDLVIRRRMRAPLRMAHILKGASPEEIEKYRAQVEKDQTEGTTTDYYMNKEGGVSAVQGDSNLDQMADIVYLLDTFFSGSPLPKGMMGYTEGMARDILEDLKRDYYDEIDVIQDTLSFVYEAGFRLQLLLKGINPDDEDFKVTFASRRTETMTQTVDIGLKMKALGYPQGMVYEYMGDDPAYVERRRKWEAENYDPYPDALSPSPSPAGGRGEPKVSVTPGNGRKGESGTSISNKTILAEYFEELSPAPDAGMEAVKMLGEVARALSDKPVPVAAAAAPIHVHIGDTKPQAVVPAAPQPIQLTAQFNMPDNFGKPADINIPGIQVDVHVPPAVPPIVHVAAPNVQVDVAAPAVTVEATLPTPEITVHLPARKTETTMKHNAAGDVISATQIESDIK